MAATVQINFKIGGAEAVARAVTTILQQTERAAKASTRATESATRAKVKAEVDASKAILREINAQTGAKVAAERQASQIIRGIRRADQQQQMASIREHTRAENRALAERARAESAAARQRQRTLSGVVGGAIGGAKQAGNLALSGGRIVAGVGGQLMSGAGIEVSLARAVRNKSALEKGAVDLSNSGYQANEKGIAGTRVDPKKLMAQASQVGMDTATDPTKALEGMAGFTKVTGDLATAQAVLPDLAKLARATGSDLDQVVTAAGEFAKAMGDAAENEDQAKTKAKAIYDLMRGIAGGGKLGSVEIGDMAKHGARLAAAATQFEGDAGGNIMKMGMLAQEARGGGGAWNPATAAASVSGLVTTLTTPARAKHFADKGINLKGEGGKLRDPVAIISEAIEKTGGDMNQLQPMFANVVGKRAMQGLANKYLEGSGGKTDEKSKTAGREAMMKEIDRMTKGATMTPKEVEDSFNASMNTTEAKAQKFQQNIDKVASELADKLIPAFTQLIPVINKGVPILTQFVDAMAQNGPALAAQLERLVAIAPQAANALAKLISFAIENPELAGAAVVLKGAGAALMTSSAQLVVAAGAIGILTGKKIADTVVGNAENNSSNTSDATNLASQLRRGKGTATDRKKAEMMANQYELQGSGSFWDRFQGGMLAESMKIQEGGFSLGSAGRLLAMTPTALLSAGLGGGVGAGDNAASAAGAAQSNAQGAAAELRAALDGSAVDIKNPGALGAAIAGPVGDAVRSGIAEGLAGAGLQLPKAQGPD